jgi:two-component system cell cycle sensor histidine kinase PleC
MSALAPMAEEAPSLQPDLLGLEQISPDARRRRTPIMNAGTGL